MHDEDGADDDDDLLWEEFSRRWEDQITRLNEVEDAMLRRMASQVHELALHTMLSSHSAAVETAQADVDSAVRLKSKVSAEVEDAQRKYAVRQVHHDAARARSDITHDALQEADDLVRNIAHASAQRRRDLEAKRKQAKQARSAELEARRRRREEAERARTTPTAPPEAADASDAQGEKTDADAGARPPPPPSADAGRRGPGRDQPRCDRPSARPRVFECFAAFDEAWAKFDLRLRGHGAASQIVGDIGLDDIPWPTGLPTVSGIDIGDALGERKRKLRAAVLRWHPDKWGPLLARVRSEERTAVAERAQEVTRKILDERRKFAG